MAGIKEMSQMIHSFWRFPQVWMDGWRSSTVILPAHLAVCEYRWASPSSWKSYDYVKCFFIFLKMWKSNTLLNIQSLPECFDNTEFSWLLQYVWVEKEQILIISSAQRGSGLASGFIRGYWLLVTPFNVPDNQPQTGTLTTASFLLFFFLLLLLFSVNSKRGSRPGN